MSKKSKGKQDSVRASAPRVDSKTLLLLGSIILISAAIVILVWFALTPNRNAGGVSQMQVSAERLDLGTQIFNQPARATFTITNVGNGTLTLSVPRAATLLEGC